MNVRPAQSTSMSPCNVSRNARNAGTVATSSSPVTDTTWCVPEVSLSQVMDHSDMVDLLLSASVAPPVELAAHEMVPPAVGAHLDDVAHELLVRGAESFELRGVGDAASVRGPQLIAVDVGHEAHRLAGAHRAVVARGV